MDEYWTAAADALRSSGATVISAPAAMEPAIDVHADCYSATAPEAKYIQALAIHKGQYKDIDKGFLKAALERLRLFYANEVFIVLAQEEGKNSPNADHLAALGEIAAWALGPGADRLHQSPSPALDAMHRIALAEYSGRLQSSTRALEPRRLIRFGQRAFSQNDEDGILGEIFRRIGVKSKHFVEFGVESGAECNTQLLVQGGWSGLWLDGSDLHVAAARHVNQYAIDTGRLEVTRAFVTAENIDGLISGWIARRGISPEVDVLSIDIDGNDYYVWNAIRSIAPRVVIIEYNALYPAPFEFVIPYRADATWDLSSYSGVSLKMLEHLGRTKGYSLVGCCLAGVNAFFVRNDLLKSGDADDLFHAPYTAEEHYEPVRHGLFSRPFGHRHGFGPNGADEALAKLRHNE